MSPWKVWRSADWRTFDFRHFYTNLLTTYRRYLYLFRHNSSAASLTSSLQYLLRSSHLDLVSGVTLQPNCSDFYSYQNQYQSLPCLLPGWLVLLHRASCQLILLQLLLLVTHITKCPHFSLISWHLVQLWPLPSRLCSFYTDWELHLRWNRPALIRLCNNTQHVSFSPPTL